MDKRPLTCVTPKATRAVSVTGPACSLGCAHCGGHYLKAMTDFRTADLAGMGRPEGGWAKVKSLLVSGGCSPEGQVPLEGDAERLRRLAGKYRLNAHPGLVDDRQADAIASWADVVSLDFVSDEATLREVYGLAAGPERYVETLRTLRRRLPVVPHLCLGLRGGVIGPEYEALARLADEGVDDLVVLVFIPTPGTRYAGRTSPPADEVGRFLATARERLPEARITLGCMRPKGRYREEVDAVAVQAGVDVIVQPAPAARRVAQAEGRPLVSFDECCAFLTGERR